MKFRLPFLLFTVWFFSIASGAEILGQTANSATKSEVKRLVYQVQEVRDIEVASNPTTETLSTDVYIKEGPKLNSRRLVQYGQAPALSWNGEKVAFFGFCRFDVVPCWQINVINADGSGRKKITNVPYGVFAFTWSPVDDTLAYFDHPKLDGHAVVVVINADGSGRRELTKSLDLRCGADSWQSIDWSPEGNRLAFTACNDGQRAVVTMGKNGEDAKAVVNGFGPRWSPNGKQLLFHHNSDGSPVVPSIWVANADGTEPRRLLDGEHAGYGLTWFPDGKSIAFASDRENNKQAEVFRINLDGTGLEKIATGTGVSYSSPIISPDGLQLIVDATIPWHFMDVTDDFGVWLIDIASHRQEKLVKGNHAGIFWGKK